MMSGGLEDEMRSDACCVLCCGVVGVMMWAGRERIPQAKLPWSR